MAVGILPDQGIADILSYILSAPISGVLPWELRLWTNDLDPTSSTVLADLVEATWIGYNRVTMNRELWTVPTVLEGCAASTWGTAPQVWTCADSGNPVNFGVAYVDRSTGKLRWVQRFEDGDIRALTPGAQLKVLPQFTLSSAECTDLVLGIKRGARKRVVRGHRRG